MSDRTEGTPNGRLSVRDYAFLLTLLVQLVTAIWWASRLTSTVDSLTITVNEMAGVVREMQQDQTDLKVRLAVQEALNMRAAQPGAHDPE